MNLQEYRFGMDYGVGLNSLSGAVRGDGVIYGEEEVISNAGGQNIQFHLEKIESIAELQESLGVSVEADVSFGPFGGASARFDFAESCQMNSYSIYLIVRIEVINAFRQIRDVRLKPQAYELLRQGKLDRFREQYGDGYVRGISTGGAFFALLEFKTKTVAQQQAISAELEAGGGLGMTYSIEADFNQKVQSLTKNHALTIHTFQQGGHSTKQPTTADEMIKMAATFASQVSEDKAVPYEALFQDYKALDMPDLPNLMDLKNAKEVLQDLSYQRNQIRKILNDVEYVLLNQSDFMSPDVDELNQDANALKTCLRQVTRTASQAINRPLDAQRPTINIPEVDLPLRKDGKPVVKFEPKLRLGRYDYLTVAKKPDLSHRDKAKQLRHLFKK